MCELAAAGTLTEHLLCARVSRAVASHSLLERLGWAHADGHLTDAKMGCAGLSHLPKVAQLGLAAVRTTSGLGYRGHPTLGGSWGPSGYPPALAKGPASASAWGVGVAQPWWAQAPFYTVLSSDRPLSPRPLVCPVPQAPAGSSAGPLCQPAVCPPPKGCELAQCLVTWGPVVPSQPEDLGLGVATRPPELELGGGEMK